MYKYRKRRKYQAHEVEARTLHTAQGHYEVVEEKEHKTNPGSWQINVHHEMQTNI